MVSGSWSWDGEEAVAVQRQPQLQPYAGHKWGWDGEKYPGGWGVDETAVVDSMLNLDYYTLRERSSQLFETNLYARGIIRRLVTNEVHVGLRLEARPVALMLGISDEALHEWTDRTEAFWEAWTKEPRVCDFEQRQGMTFGELTAAARREALIGGDVLVVLRHSAATNLPTVQLIGGHQVVQPLQFAAKEGHIIDNGVELDAEGRQVAYHVNGSTADQMSVGIETTRIEAFAPDGQRVAWLMYGTDKRIGQNRGVPLLGLILQSLREIDRYRDSVQRKAVIQSIITMWIEKKEDKMGSVPLTGGAVRAGQVSTSNYDGTPRTINMADQIPGMVLEELQHGETPHAFKADGGDTMQFGDFQAAIISAVLWACEIPPEIGVLSFDSNYSASQAALNEFKIYLIVQRERIAQGLNQPVYQDWLQASVRRNTIDAPGLLESAADLSKFEMFHAWSSADWIGAVKPVTDLFKMAKAYEILVAHGWTTNARVAGELTGTKFQTNAKIIMREREELPSNDTMDDPPELSAALATSLVGDS